MVALKRAFKSCQLMLICLLAVAGYWSLEAGWSGWVVDVFSTGWNWGVLVAPNLTSCDVLGMLLKYWLSTEGGFIGGERVNPVGVLVSGGLLWHPVSVVVTGGDMAYRGEELGLCEASYCDVCWLCCCVGCSCCELWTVCWWCYMVTCDVDMVVVCYIWAAATMTIWNAVLGDVVVFGCCCCWISCCGAAITDMWCCGCMLCCGACSWICCWAGACPWINVPQYCLCMF